MVDRLAAGGSGSLSAAARDRRGGQAAPGTQALADHEGTVRDLAEYDAGLDQTAVGLHLKYDSFGNIIYQSGRVAGVERSEPPEARISGGSLALDPGHPRSDQPDLELLSILENFTSTWGPWAPRSAWEPAFPDALHRRWLRKASRVLRSPAAPWERGGPLFGVWGWGPGPPAVAC